MPENDFSESLREAGLEIEDHEEPAPEGPTMPEAVKNCWSAIKAAAETLGEYCGGIGMVAPIEIEGVSVSAPQEVVDIAKLELSTEDRIEAIAESDWVMATAADTCEKLFRATPGTPEYERCVETTARRLAEELID